MDEKTELLGRVPLFAECSDEELEAIAALTADFRLSGGRELMAEGEIGRALIVVVEGEVVVDRDGERIAEGGPGDFFGEIALLTGRPRTATVTATTDARVLVLDGHRFEQLLQEVPTIAVGVLKAVADRLAPRSD